MSAKLQAPTQITYIPSMTLRLASYNIHKCLGMDRRRSAARVLEVIAEVDADVIVLQEVDHRIGQRKAALSAGLIHSEGIYHALPFATNEVSLGWHGQSILVRNGIVVETLQRINLPGLEPRGAVMADLRTQRGHVRVVGVHLGLVRRYRQMQFRAIRKVLDGLEQMPTIIIGDFNEWSQTNGVAPLSQGFRVHAPGRSYPAVRPVARLDRIAVGTGAHLEAAGVHLSALARVASDHLPIWATLRLDEPGD